MTRAKWLSNGGLQAGGPAGFVDYRAVKGETRDVPDDIAAALVAAGYVEIVGPPPAPHGHTKKRRKSA
jgi:hypothetical protein